MCPVDIDSDALVSVQRQLGNSGISPGLTQFDDDVLQQTFDISAAIRRSRADIAGGGLFFGILRNAMAGSDDEVSSVDPYNVGVTLATETFPARVDTTRFDLWLLGASFNVFSGAATATNVECMLEVDLSVTGRLRAFGVDDAGAVAAFGGTLSVAIADGVKVVGGATRLFNTVSGQAWTPLRMRMPTQGSIIRFLSTKGDATAGVWDAIFLLGLFPIGMGQDVLGDG